MEKEQKKEFQSVKYIRELTEYLDAYIAELIDEIFIAVGIDLGLDEKKARRLAKNKPQLLQKAFFKNIFDKLKIVFRYKIPKFNIKRGIFGTGRPMTEAEWQKFNASIDNYWREHANSMTENAAVKGFMLGRNTTDFRQKNKPYQNKSLYQVEFDQYDGKMPETISEAYRNYDFTNAEKNALNKTFSKLALHVAETNNEIKESIRQQVQNGIEDNKSSQEIASDLYWEIQKGELNNKYTAERLKRNWNRIAITETASIYEAGILAPYEAEAMESMKDEKKAKYFVFTGGTCPWCRAHHGVVVRLVPASIVPDTGNDSLRSMGIKDPNTDIAIWVGKNNVGFKKNKSIDEWRVCTPAHPHNVATFQPIDLETEYYNTKTGRVEHRQKKYPFVPKKIDYSYESKEEKEFRKPVFIGDNLVRKGYNTYEAVDHNEYNKKLKAYEKDATLPIPVDRNSTDYRYIFEEAEKNR